MASESIKKVQGKLFRGEGIQRSQQPESRGSPGLAIHIPHTVPPPSTPNPPPKLSKFTSDGSPKDGRSYRDRVLEALAGDYHGVERYRLLQDEKKERHWKKWGPYLSERQWVSLTNLHGLFYQLEFAPKATVREDYSGNGDAWSHFPHEHARSRAYRWGEDGIAGISDNHQRLCFSLALWNGEDPILKERLFGVTGHQGNHGEDVKELYYYLDSTPTHSYMKYLYKYPQRRYPYEELVNENMNRDRDVSEFEILDSDVFDEDRYWDVFVEVFAASFFSDSLLTSFIVRQGRRQPRQCLHSHHSL